VNDLWQRVAGDFTELTHMLSRVLSNSDVELLIRQTLDEAGFPWSEIAQVYRAEPTFPKNVVRLALASDCLRIMVGAILVHGEVKDEEINTVHSLSEPLCGILASLGRYSPYDNLRIDETLSFLQAFIDDPNWFGGETSCPTNFLGLHLSAYVSTIDGHQKAMLTYERIIRAVLAGVFGDARKTRPEQEYVDSVNDSFIALCRSASLEAPSRDRKVIRQLSVSSDPPHAVLDDDRWINELLEDVTDQSTSAESAEDTEQALEDAIADLHSLIGLDGVKAEVKRLMSFLNIQRHRKLHGLKKAGQTLHFVLPAIPALEKRRLPV